MRSWPANPWEMMSDSSMRAILLATTHDMSGLVDEIGYPIKWETTLMPPAPESGNPGVATASERRVRALIDSLLETEGLSRKAKEMLRHLQSSDRELANAEVEDLMELLQEGGS